MDKKIKIYYKKFQKPLIIIAILIIALFIGFVVKNSFSDPNTGYLRNQTINNLSFENAALVFENGITTYTVEVHNESGDVYDLKTISVNLKDKDQKVTTLIGYIGNLLDKDETKILKVSIDQDLSNTISVDYVVNK